MEDIKSSELIAINALIQNNLQNVNKALGIETLNDLLEVNQPKQGEVETKKHSIFFGGVSDQLFNFWVKTLEWATLTIEEISEQNLTSTEQLEIVWEQVQTLTEELIAESQKVMFWQEEVEACNKEIETLNIELQSYSLLVESPPLDSECEVRQHSEQHSEQKPGRSKKSLNLQEQVARMRQNQATSKTLTEVASKTIAKARQTRMESGKVIAAVRETRKNYSRSAVVKPNVIQEKTRSKVA